MNPGVGDRAPDFELDGFPAGIYSPKMMLGRTLVLAFYPEDHSPVCTLQLRAYSEGMPDFASLGATVWGISPQDPEAHRSFAERQSLSVPLLSDLDRKVGSAYGVLGPLGFYKRSVFVINRQGIVTFCHRTTAGLTYQPTSTLLKAIRDAEAASS